MFRIKSFQRRVLLALMAVALVPAAILIYAGTEAFQYVATVTGTAGPWGSLAESGQTLLEEVEAAGIENSELTQAANAHQEALSDGLRQSQIFSLLMERAMELGPWMALILILLTGGLSFWAARQLSRGFSRPIRDLVGWTALIGRGDDLPPPTPTQPRGVEEFAILRDALRQMAGELEEGRREAVQSAKLRSWTDMGRRVAHELKNPLTPMRMAAASVSRMEGHTAQEAGAVLLEEIARLDDMARTFSQFGRMPEAPASEVDMEELLDLLVQQHQPVSSGREGDWGEVDSTPGPEILFEAQEGLPLIRGHYDALVRSFRNILLNAIDAAGPSGRVEVEVGGIEGGVRTEIRDSGPGIDDNDLTRIWDPEFSTKSSGTGLGLPMVRQTIRLHRGRVEGRNHPEGGAVFLVELPLEGPVGAKHPEAE